MAAPDPLPERFDDDDLLLRRWTASDATALHTAITTNIDHLRPWVPWITFEPQTLEQRATLIEKWEQEWHEGGDVVLAVVLAGAVVGSTGLHRCLEPDGLEIGYWIDGSHIGRGLATRVSRLLTTAAFSLPGISYVQIRCDQANTASVRVPEKLGFTHVGNIDTPIVAPSETGSRRIYRMTRTEWAQRG